MTIEITINDLIKLINAYTGNKGDLNDLKMYLEEDGILDTGVSEIEETFEQGYNNALEYTFNVLGLTDNLEDIADDLEQQIEYEEKRLNSCAYGKSDLMYLEELKSNLNTIRNFLYNK